MLLSLLLCAFNISHHKKVQNLEINNGMKKNQEHEHVPGVGDQSQSPCLVFVSSSTPGC